MLRQDEELARAVADLCLEDYSRETGATAPSWNPWGLYADPEVARAVLRRLVRAVDRLTPQVDILCPIPRSGYAIAGAIYASASIPLMASFHSGDHTERARERFHALSQEFGRPLRVCLVDEVIHTGTRLFVATERLHASMPAEIAATICVADYDLIPQEHVNPMKMELRQSGKLQCLFRVSELRALWTPGANRIAQLATA